MAEGASTIGERIVTAAQCATLAMLCVLGGCVGPGLEPPDGDDDGFGNAPEMDRTHGADGADDVNGADAGVQGMDGDPTDGRGTADGETTAPGAGLPVIDGGAPAPDGTRDEDAGSDDAGAPTGDPAGQALFMGVWAVEQPFHALYEGTLYELLGDGSLMEHETVTLGGQAGDFVTGTVEASPGGTSCRLEGSWRAAGPRRLVVDSSCSDDIRREVRLDFPEGEEYGGLIPQVTVEGQPSWTHGGFEWSWRKCDSLDGCLQVF